jgi:uncharacterized membrane protein (UPF0127 family)
MDSNQNKPIPLFEGYCKQKQVDNINIDCKLGSFFIKLKIASTPESQSIGFQNAKLEPKDDEGILFVYPHETHASFWMKNVNFPLEILFFNSNKELVQHETMQPNTYPKTYTSNIPVRYAIETRAGWYNRHGEKQLKLHL